MSLRRIPGKNQQYHLIAYDKKGEEVPDADGSSASELALADLADPAAAVTDVFVISHGWQGDYADAMSQYDRWVGATDPDAAGDGIRPFVIGVHWPSKAWSDRELKSRASGLLGATPDPPDAITVDEAVESQRPMIEGQGLRIETDIDERALCVVDPLRIRQVLDNLLTNAVKYNRKGGVVRVSLHDDGSFVRIAVSDTGVGISKADQKRLFERYFRTESARQSSVHGSGLGLNITAEIIKEHGGELAVSSVPGVGSTFEIILPSLGAAAPVVGASSTGSPS